MENQEENGEIQLKHIKKLDSVELESNASKSNDQPPPYKKAVEEGEINPTFTPESDDNVSQDRRNVETVIAVPVTTVMNGDGGRHRKVNLLLLQSNNTAL